MKARPFSAHPSGTERVTFAGELDISAREEFEQAVERCLLARPQKLQLDCSQLSFISIDSLYLLVDVAARCRSAGVALEIQLSRYAHGIVGLIEDPNLDIVLDSLAPADSAPSDGAGSDGTEDVRRLTGHIP